ncbi:YceI family protein [Gordonia sp. LSe1-13]|uniref:YceI family protein n=1 Tax=Gordonia sesuvii TaxID=3116777 RepID=A0ABU7MAN7_9ACTN|nr:YceI family protein [Gordonia sp. LSe1-13]
MTTPIITTRVESGTWTIDPTHWTIGFSVRQMGLATVRGHFTQFTGTLTINDDGTTSVLVDIDIASIATGNDRRDRHLRSSAFFDAAAYPTATFAVRGSAGPVGSTHQPAGEELTGDLTIKGVTTPAFLRITPLAHNRAGAILDDIDLCARTTVRRSDFGVGSGGVVIGDSVAVDVTFRPVPS